VEELAKALAAMLGSFVLAVFVIAII